MALLMGGALLAQSEPVNPVPVADDHPIWNDPLLDPAMVVLSADYLGQELQLGKEQVDVLKEIEDDVNARLASVDQLAPGEREAREKSLLQELNNRQSAVLSKGQRDQVAQIKKDMQRERAAKLAIQRAAESGAR
ncbi:MAG: hypothetical protein J5I62_06975 [Flavobacteriales bacterium]|nr:hypothetical protein [Flavobacteriales bacterium]MEB2341304.1 hypothetical protein [Flavobacteriia bacterium]